VTQDEELMLETFTLWRFIYLITLFPPDSNVQTPQDNDFWSVELMGNKVRNKLNWKSIYLYLLDARAKN